MVATINSYTREPHGALKQAGSRTEKAVTTDKHARSNFVAGQLYPTDQTCALYEAKTWRFTAQQRNDSPSVWCGHVIKPVVKVAEEGY
ncbi:hypothetical protein T265_03532 [Opisthorchis viverrini]|uniref:Uncharacterized protein n=1 Tax=Opisthorchis viverrini TaxID=6198 RepID=A0A075A2Y5_OPIVI|nr:hypothetical protein T265_03532 [Opisthorchis viverrini]KER29945.1 hypothetical protein T265_03532 [Opisthorchis viverrini]